MPKEMNIRLRERRDTLANWENENPVLLSGEVAIVDVDGSLRRKTGDGITAFIDLAYDDEYFPWPTADDALQLATETGLVSPVADETGALLVDETGKILIV